MNFKDQYKSPLWQKKRLEALERSGFCCECCGDGESTLHVHHKRYVNGRNVWEYDARELAVLCEPCHESTHIEKDALGYLLAKIRPEGFSDVVALLAGFCSEETGPCGIRDDETASLKSLSPLAFHAGTIAAHSLSVIARASYERVLKDRNGED